MADRNKRIKTPKGLPKKKSKIGRPSEDELEDHWTPQTQERPGTSRGRSSAKRLSSPKAASGSTTSIASPKASGSRPNIRISASSSSNTHQRSETSMTVSTPTGKASGKTYRDYQESRYSPASGKKHTVMGKKKHATIPNIRSIESAVKRGFKHNRKIDKYPSNLGEKKLAKVTEADQNRLTMMSNYFADKIEDYQQMIEKCIDDGRKKREKNAAAGIENVNALDPFRMSKKFYNMMEATVNQVYVAYRRLTHTASGKQICNYDHIMYDDQIHDGLFHHQVKFVHLVCKPHQCWMNLFQIDETAAKELTDVSLLVLEHFNKVARYLQPFPQWLIDLRGWEHSIAMQYLSKPVHVFEVIDHIKNGNYWARYHQYLREEDNAVYDAKWADGTDFFPHKSTALYWYFHESDVDHWMNLEEYIERKNNIKAQKAKRKLMKSSSKNILMGESTETIGGLDDDELMLGGADMGLSSKKSFKRKRSNKTRDSMTDEELSKAKMGIKDQGNEADNEDNDEEDEEAGLDGFGGRDGGLEFLDLMTVTDSEPEDEYSSSASDDSIPVNKYIYRCPEPIQYVQEREREDEEHDAEQQQKQDPIVWDDFAGWTAYHRSFVGFIQRDLLCIDECEREIARNPSEDHWRRRHLYLGNGYDLPICQYRLISKKLNLEHEVRENLRMIAILKKNGISASAPLTQVEYMPEWVKFKAQTHFNKLYGQIRKQQQEYTPQKKQLLESLKAEIQIRDAFNSQIRRNIGRKREKLQDNLSKLKMLHDRQISLLDYIVTAKHRVANAKLKVAYAREQVEILENDVKDLREMTPREQKFAERNKHYYEAVSINKLCKQYHSLKRNNYDPNQIYLSQYREKIKRLLKNVALYNLWYWSIKQRYKTHKKYEVIQTANDLINPCKDWMVDDAMISEMLLSNEKLYQSLNAYDPHRMRKEHFVFHLQQKKEKPLPDDNEDGDEPMDHEDKPPQAEEEEEKKLGPTPQIERDRIEFEKIFYRKKQETAKYAALNMGNPVEQQHLFEQKWHAVMRVMEKFRSDDLQQRKSRPNTRQSISSRSGYKRRRISEHDIPAFYGDDINASNANDGKKVVSKEALDRQLAGGQRVDDDDEDSEFDDEDDDQWYDEEHEREQDYGSADDDDDDRSDYSTDEEEDGGGDQEEDRLYNYRSNPQFPNLQNFKPTIYTEDAESVVYTDDDVSTGSEEEEEEDEEEDVDPHGTQNNLTGLMGDSGYLTGGDRLEEDEYETGDSETQSDDDDYETGDEELVTDNEYDEKLQHMQNSRRGVAGGGYGAVSGAGVYNGLQSQQSFQSGYGGGGSTYNLTSQYSSQGGMSPQVKQGGRDRGYSSYGIPPQTGGSYNSAYGTQTDVNAAPMQQGSYTYAQQDSGYDIGQSESQISRGAYGGSGRDTFVGNKKRLSNSSAYGGGRPLLNNEYSDNIGAQQSGSFSKMGGGMSGMGARDSFSKMGRTPPITQGRDSFSKMGLPSGGSFSKMTGGMGMGGHDILAPEDSDDDDYDTGTGDDED